MKNLKANSLLAIATFFILMWSACAYDQVVPGANIGDVGEMSFTSDIIPIFNESCNMSGCHDVGDQVPDLSPANAYTVLINDGYINTTNPKESSLYKWMNDEESLSMPLTGPDALYNAKVLAWIEQGALNN
ncbi:MAG: hypothetical protein KJP21_06910 [Bacteroidia bacterium]|nr:hypothetical protein [Bacteroidia bacterium]NNJ56306.1 hypothetical protein [Bacteroidia bacterium]